MNMMRRFFLIIFDNPVHWMPYVILWGSADLDLLDNNFSRVSNAFVESKHKVNKDGVFGKHHCSLIADIIRRLEVSAGRTQVSIDFDRDLQNLSKIKPSHYHKLNLN